MSEDGYEIVGITDISSKKRFVRLSDNGKSFALYNQEIRKFALEEGVRITPEQYADIMRILEDRARNRALHIVTRRDITERQLADKLTDGKYPENIINITIQFMKEHGFINDARIMSGARQIREAGARWKHTFTPRGLHRLL